MATTVQQLIIQMKVTGASQAKQTIANALAGGSVTPGSGGSGGSGANVSLSSITSAYAIFRVFDLLARSVNGAINSITTFSREILSIQQLTGSTFKEAGGISSLMRVAGISDTQGLREMTHVAQAMYSSSGRSAMNFLGVNPKQGESGVAILGRVFDALDKMHDGIRKTNAEIAIFGARNTAAAQALLRMPKAIRDIALRVGESINPRDIGRIDQMNMMVRLLMETVQDRILIPLAGQIIPPLIEFTSVIVRITDALGRANDATSGFLGAVGAVVGLIGGLALGLAGLAKIVTLVAGAWTSLWTTLGTLGATGGAFGAIESIVSGALAFLLTPIGAIVGVLTILVGAFALWKWNESQNSDKIEDNTKRAADALEDIRGHMIGGGRNTKRVTAEIEVERAISRAFGYGLS